MGTYLATGIVQDMIIKKREIADQKLTIEAIVDQLKKEVSIDHYHYGEDENTYFWKINSKIFEGNLAEFLETQFRMYNPNMNPSMEETIRQVRDATTGDQLIELAASRSLIRFQLVDYISTPIRVLRQDGFTFSVMVYYHLIAFFMDGKIIMECYKNILGYFDKNIRLQKAQYPIVDCVKTCITG